MKPKRSVRIATGWSLILLWPLLSRADITFDGTLPGGAAAGYKIGNAPNANVVNNDMAILASYGKQSGSNLFHSFSQFNVDTGQSATFTNGGATGAISNVIGRVTGGSPSTIDGALRSTVAGADLYLVNPSGIVFGANATLDVPGSFYASTADSVKLADGTVYSASAPSAPVLTSSAPASFGFLDSPADIRVDGATLEVGDGNTLALVAGGITIADAEIGATGGNIRMTALTQGRDVSIEGNDAFSPAQEGGDIVLENTSLDAPSSATRTGGIALRGGEITLVDSYLYTGTDTDADGGPISLLGRDITLTRTQFDTSSMSLNGSAGDISLLASGQVSLKGEAFPDGSSYSTDLLASAGGLLVDPVHWWVAVRSPSNGDGGTVTIQAHDISLTESAGIYTETVGPGHAGAVRMDAGGQVLLSGFSEIYSVTDDGTGGTVSVHGQDILIRDGASILTKTFGSGNAGSVDLAASGRVELSGVSLLRDSSWISSQAEFQTSGHAGTISIRSGDISLSDGASIEAHTSGSGNAGDIALNAAGSLFLDNESGIATSSIYDGNGGHIAIRASDIRIQGDSYITAGSYGSGVPGDIDISATDSLLIQDGGSVTAESHSGAAGGDISIFAGRVDMKNGALITALNDSDGNAGNLTITASEVNLSGGSALSVESREGDAGNIALFLSKWLYLLDSRITTSAAGGLGNGGNILIDPQFVILNNSQIIANALQGAGGNITIITQFFLASTNSLVSASSQFGLQGTVSIQSAQSNIAGSISVLPGVFMDASGLIQEGCGRSGQSSSTFTSSSLHGQVLASPDNALDYIPASLEGCSLAL